MRQWLLLLWLEVMLVLAYTNGYGQGYLSALDWTKHRLEELLMEPTVPRGTVQPTTADEMRAITSAEAMRAGREEAAAEAAMNNPVLGALLDAVPMSGTDA